MIRKRLYILSVSLLLTTFAGHAQTRALDFFLAEGLKNDPSLMEISNLQQYYQVQNEFIAAQNKKPQVSLTADYLFAPFFANNGRVISVTANPSSKAFGYDAAITNGGVYATQLNVLIPVFNTSIVKRLYEQNKIQSDISAFGRTQVEHVLNKSIIDQYIVAYQFQQQTTYLQKIIDQLQDRKPLVEALVKQGLLQQSDFLLLDIQLITNKNDLQQLRFAYMNAVAILKNLALIKDTATYTLQEPSISIKADPDELNYIQKYRLDSLNLVAQQNVFNSRYQPQVSLLGSTGINAAEISNIPHNVGVSAGIHLSVPISDGHQRDLYRRQQDILLKNQQAYFNSAATIRQNNLRNAKQQIDQWQQVIMMTSEPIKKQELLLDIIKDKVVKGQVTVMDYINALQDYAVLQKNRAMAETNLLLYINEYNYYNW